MLKTLFSLIGESRKRRMLLLLPAMLLGSLLEMLGLSMIVAVCSLLLGTGREWQGRLPARFSAALPPGAERGLFAGVLLALAALYIFKLLYLSWENHIVTRFVRAARGEVCGRLFRRVIRAPYAYFARHSTSELQNLLGLDMDRLGDALSACMDLLLEGVTALGMAAFLLLLDPAMTLFAAGCAAALLLLLRAFQERFVRQNAERQRLAGRERSRWLHMVMAGIKDIRTGGHEDFFCARFAGAETEFARAEAIRQFWGRFPALCIETALVLAVLLYILFLLLTGAELARFFPGLSAFAVATVRLMPACRRVNGSLTRLCQDRASLEGIRRAFEQTTPPKTTAAGQEKTVAFTQGISLRGVSCGYEDRPDPVLRDVTMDIPVGAAVGIIGCSGAGKTTLLDIILGLLPPRQGEVLIDGVPVQKCAASYLQRVAYVPQTPFLLDDTVRGNVALGREPGGIDERRVWAALEKAALAGTVKALPQGLDTRVGEGGICFSGGERQRLSLARALYREAGVIVLDEATSALDLETEAEVLRTLDRVKSGKTLILVSHRMSAIAGCDHVYRVADGRVLRER